jgi:hypothetical protein
MTILKNLALKRFDMKTTKLGFCLLNIQTKKKLLIMFSTSKNNLTMVCSLNSDCPCTGHRRGGRVFLLGGGRLELGHPPDPPLPPGKPNFFWGVGQTPPQKDHTACRTPPQKDHAATGAYNFFSICLVFLCVG